ncbi:hypothetical protein [Terribacillus sp. AE2B 122]|nr:hypothetical protein [Terribacillus sp. AE2B 122]
MITALDTIPGETRSMTVIGMKTSSKMPILIGWKPIVSNIKKDSTIANKQAATRCQAARKDFFLVT